MENKSEEKENEPYKGFDLYPERRSQKEKTFFYNIYEKRVDHNSQLACEEKVLKAIKNNPVIKVLLGALKKAGCPVNLQRHIVCEECSNLVTGGYDTEYNQIVICKNNSFFKQNPEPTLVHELIHMYDKCVAKVDFNNLEHLACSEIRAANIAHCSFTSSFFLGHSSFFKIKQTHQDCVKYKAAEALMFSRNLDYETAIKYVLKVFDKCYNDLEPVGRRLIKNSSSLQMVLKEAQHYGICDKE